jgi:hypothetical protein
LELKEQLYLGTTASTEGVTDETGKKTWLHSGKMLPTRQLPFLNAEEQEGPK